MGVLKPPKKPKKSKKQQANTLEAEGDADFGRRTEQPEEQTKSKKNNGKSKNKSKSKGNKAPEAEALGESEESAKQIPPQIELKIPLAPLKVNPKTKGGQVKPPREQTMRQWLEFVTGRQKEWKMSRKMQEAPKVTSPILPPVPAKPVEAEPTVDLDAFAFLEPSTDKQRREADLQQFVHAVSWTQFRQFLTGFHESHWAEIFRAKRRLKSFVEKCMKIFGAEANTFIAMIGPHLPQLTAETLYRARKDSIEGIPLAGDVPYLAAFVSKPVSCPCTRGAGQNGASAEGARDHGCCCYSAPNLEIFGNQVGTMEDVQARIAKLTKSKHKVFVENLHPEIGVRELMQMFCKIGRVEAVEIFRERLSGEGESSLESVLSLPGAKKQKSKKNPASLIRRQVTGLSPVYAWVYFSEAAGAERALLPVVRILGINFLKHEARTHPVEEKRILHLGNLPPMPIGGFEGHIMGLLSDGTTNNASLVQLLHPPSNHADAAKESARHGFCLAEFTDHRAALAAYQTLTTKAMESDEKRKLRVGWAMEEVNKSSQGRIRSVEREVRVTHQHRLERMNGSSLPNSGRSHNDDWSDGPDTLNDYEDRPLPIIRSTSGSSSANIGVNGQPSIVLKRVGQFVTRSGQVLG